jgi:pyruvate kinase
MPRRTKIVATLGPATAQPGVLEAMLQAGVDVVRLNLSHGSHSSHRHQLEVLREVCARQQRSIGVMLDLQGPKIRIERFRAGSALLKQGQRFVLDAALAAEDGDEHTVGITYKALPQDVAAGDVLLLADGLIQLQVEQVEGARVLTTVTVGGLLGNGKGINRLGGGLSVAALTDKDREDIRFAAEVEADYLAVSFPRNAADIEEARRLLRAAGGQGGLVAKIERREALDDLDAIMHASDAVMIARGDLAVEIGDAELAGVQKDLLHSARSRDCVVITATQMMQSMVHSPQPTRAEVLDVANAILDGTDAVMLSEETAAGEYPVTVVEAMARICVGTETYQRFHRAREEAHAYRYVDEAIAKASIDTANRLNVKAIAAFTESGSTPMWMSRIGTEVPIYAFTRHPPTHRKVSLYRGVYPRSFDVAAAESSTVNRTVVASLQAEGAVEDGDLVIITKGDLAGVEGGTNTLKIVRVGSVP